MKKKSSSVVIPTDKKNRKKQESENKIWTFNRRSLFIEIALVSILVCQYICMY